MQEANALLALYAVPIGGMLGRTHIEADDETRFPFQRDRDRIIHTQAFRRLKHKTQVFIADKGDHYRTRLTHTMEVAQISRDMARTLNLNEDLAEAIALAHDLGHTPYGHAGEEAMHEEMQRWGGSFEHNAQSLRIVTVLEERSKRYPGLNLNGEILEGLQKHRTSFDRGESNPPHAPSLEAQIVNLADEVAYTAHDIDDGLRAGVFSLQDLLRIPLFREAHERSEKSGTEVRGSIIHLLVTDTYAETEHRLRQQHIQTLEGVYSSHIPIVSFSDAINEKLALLRNALTDRFYRHPDVITHSTEGKRIIHALFRAFEKHPPEKVQELQKKTGSSLPEAIKDYIAGMTDQFAMDAAMVAIDGST